MVLIAWTDRFLWLLRGTSRSSGQTLVEYSLILAFVASMVVAIGFMVGGAGGLLDDIQNALETALS
jgi:Flp pilus assembly pilin Flp